MMNLFFPRIPSFLAFLVASVLVQKAYGQARFNPCHDNNSVKGFSTTCEKMTLPTELRMVSKMTLQMASTMVSQKGSQMAQEMVS